MAFITVGTENSTDIELYYAFPEKTDNFVLPLQSFDHTRPRSGRKPPE